MRKAISYWAIRACVSGSAIDSYSLWLRRLIASSERLRVAASTPEGLDRKSTGSPFERRATPWYLLGRKPADQSRLYRAWAAALLDQLAVITTKAGRFWFIVPRP